jgi:hypothetical protein
LSDKEYFKFQVAIPKNFIIRLNWEAGDNLEGKITTKGLLIYKTEQKQRQERIGYEQFRERITSTLASFPQGCAWTELRLKAGLTQVTPSPIWVKMIENEGILKRFQEPSTSRIIWKSPKEHFAPKSMTLTHWMSATGKDV